jgi:mobilization protein NikA
VKKTSRLWLRVSLKEKREFERKARRLGLSVSEFLRIAGLMPFLRDEVK